MRPVNEIIVAVLLVAVFAISLLCLHIAGML